MSSTNINHAAPPKAVLVTGGAGFLGSHLCDRLLAEGRDVLCVDNLSTGHMENIEHQLGNRHFTFLHHDVTAPLSVEVDAIYNLACPASPVHYRSNPVQTTRTCVVGAINMLELAVRLNVPICQASTSEVYGDPAVHPQTETYHGNVNPIGPRSCYDEGKRCAETLFFDYRRQYGTIIKVVRIFNTYGPRLRAGDGRVISNFIMQASAGKSVTVYGDGSQTRSFCYVDDLVDGMIRMMNSEPGFEGPVNIGNPREITIRELAETIVSLTGSTSRLTYKPLPTDDPRQRRPDISLARRELGWTPEVSLEQGLQKTIGSPPSRR